MNDNAKYRDSCVTFGRTSGVLAWCIGCFCLLFVTSQGFAIPGAIVVNGNLQFNGNSIVVDSFDSSVPGLNINGRYDPSVAGDEGFVFAGETGSNSVAIGNADVYGTLYTGPGAVVSLGSSGAIGTHAWQASGGTGIEPGYFFNTANFVLPDIAVPSGLSYLQPGSGQVVTQDGPPTSQLFMDVPELPTLSSNQSLVSVTTNTALITVATYPGPFPGLVTNITMVTTNTYPGNVTGLMTNCVSFVTVTNTDPGPQPCLTVDSIGSVTTAYYPGPIYGLVTNTIITPATPPCITTNGGCSDPITSATLPDSWCAANGIQTNCGAVVTNTSYPTLGTWCVSEGITTNFAGPHKVVGYTYYPTVGYTYT